MRIERHCAAQREVVEATRYYAAAAPHLTGQFVAEFDEAVLRSAAHPNAWPPVGGGLRRCLLTKFPYQIIYRVEGEVIRIYAVAHAKQRPGYWMKRVVPQGG